MALIAISFYGGAVSYGLFWGVTLIPVISLIYLLYIYSNIKIYQKADKENLVCGQPAPYQFILQNKDNFGYTGIHVKMHSSFSYAEDSFENVEFELLPGERSVCETRIVCKYRGEYEIGVKEVILTDFLRLFRFHYTVPGQIEATVLPRIVQLKELKSIADLPMLVLRDTIGSKEPDILVRDYVEGDSLKQIHWKATARQQKLKVRIMTGKENQGISVFCDTRHYSNDRNEFLPLENKILEVFLAVSCYFAGAGKEFCAYYGQNGVVRKRVEGMSQFDEFYHEVSEICFGLDENLLAMLEEAADGGALWGNRLVFFVLHELSPGILYMTEQLAASGVIVVIYVITDQNPEDYEKQGTTRRRVVVIPVEGELEGRL